MTPGPLSGMRIVVTLPPHVWFGGVDYNFAVEMADELRGLGATLFELDVAGFASRNDVYIEDAIEAMRRFRPDVAVSLPNALYVLLCVTSKQENVFRDVLQIPVVMLWDHGLLQFPKQLLAPLPTTAEGSTAGCIGRLRKALDHPLYIHYSPDKGHVAAMEKLGVISARQVRLFLQPAYPNFVHHAYRTPPGGAFRTRMAFAGNVYMNAAEALAFRKDAVLAGIEARVVAAKQNRLTECLWDLLRAEIDAIEPAERKRLRLDPNQSFFWQFAHEEIEVVGNTKVRLDVLTGLTREFDFYGNFVEPDAVTRLRSQYRIKFRKCLDYFTELPLLFMNSDVIVDIINLGYNSGISPKVMGCFACGGLVLFDYKADFHQAMGEAGNQVMYRSVDHLNTLVEGYLSNPRKRRDVVRYLQHRVCTDFSFGVLAKHILADEPAWKR